jgi:hypothetical protein
VTSSYPKNLRKDGEYERPSSIAETKRNTRPSKLVREHEVLRVAARLNSSTPGNAMSIAQGEVLRWAQRRCGRDLPPSAWNGEEFESFSSGRNIVGVRVTKAGLDAWAIRADDPDKSVPGRSWTTEIVLGQVANTPYVSLRLLVSTSESYLEIVPHSPGIVQQLAARPGLTMDGIEVTTEPEVIQSNDDANNLIELLLDPRRRLPLFVLTVPPDSEDPVMPLLDPTRLARAVLGTGKVVVLPSEFTWVLTHHFGKGLSAWDGSVRAYLPGFTRNDDPYDHQLFFGPRISEETGQSRCHAWACSLAARESLRRARLDKEVIPFAKINDVRLRIKQQTQQRQGADEIVQLETAKARIEALERKSQDDESQLLYFADEWEAAVQRAEAAEKQLRSYSFQIQHLREQIEQRDGGTAVEPPLPETWSELLEWCESSLAGRVMLCPNARRNLRDPEFDDVKLAARCLVWLAKDYRLRRIDGGGDLIDEVIEPGVRNSPCGGDAFDTQWHGRRCTVDWHIKSGGNTRDPRRCLRIYFFWDLETQQVIIADMPGHRRTAAS